jgi:hypothetical protein
MGFNDLKDRSFALVEQALHQGKRFMTTPHLNVAMGFLLWFYSAS